MPMKVIVKFKCDYCGYKRKDMAENTDVNLWYDLYDMFNLPEDKEVCYDYKNDKVYCSETCEKKGKESDK